MRVSHRKSQFIDRYKVFIKTKHNNFIMITNKNKFMQVK